MSAITLEDMLAARDARCSKQQQLLKAHPDDTLVVLTVVLPGNEKRNDTSLRVARAAVKAVNQTLGTFIQHAEKLDLPTGFEAYRTVRAELTDVKRRVVEIEENHPLGRLFDLDVIAPNGVPLSRQEVGFAPRRCLLCNNEARFCMRNHTHTYSEILQYIKKLTDAYSD